MKVLKGEEGIALVTALMLTLITLSISMVMLYMVTQSLKVSSYQKFYHNSLDAGLGGIDIMTKDAVPYLLTATEALLNGEKSLSAGYYKDDAKYGLSVVMPGLDPATLALGSDDCLKAKLTSRPSAWGAACSANATSLDPTVSPDVSFVLKSAVPGAASAPGFKVSAKIISTTIGSTDLSGRDYNTSATTGAPGGDVGSPYIYRLEVTGQRLANPNSPTQSDPNNPKERANLTVLYAY